MFRYSNPTVLAEMNMGDGKTAASLDDSPLALKGKSLQVLFYKNDNGYTKISQKVAPATPFQNIMDNFTEDTIARIKQSAKKYQVKMMMVLRGEHTRAIKEYLEKIDEELNK